MAIQAQKPQGKVYPIVPKGIQHIVLVGIVDRGMQQNIYENNRLEPKISFHFETEAETPEGERYQFSKWMTNSTFYSAKTGKMSNLVKMVSEWLDVDPGQIPPAVFDDLEILCGLNARARFIHKAKDDGSMKAEMSSIEPWGDENLIAPSQSVRDINGNDGVVYPTKTIEEFWADARHIPAAPPAPPKPSRPAPDARATNERFNPKQAVQDVLEDKPRKPLPSRQNDEDEDDDDPFADA